MKPTKLYTGNTLTQENFNNIIEQLRGLENKEINIDDVQHVFGAGDDLAGSQVIFYKNTKDEVESFTVNILETTDRTPFTTNDSLVFTNEDVTNVVLDSDFQVVRTSNGALIDASNYALNGNGVLTFTNPHDENSLFVNGLKYYDAKTYYVSRDKETRKVTRIGMEPQEDTTELVEQRLHPITIAANSFEPVDILDGQGNTLATTNQAYWKLFLSNYRASYPTTDTDHFTLDLKQQLLIKRVEFDIWLQGSEYASLNIWVSKDRNNWEIAKRLRNINNTHKVGNKFVYELDLFSNFRFIRFEIIHQTATYKGIAKLQLFGYHPENKDLLAQIKLGTPNWVSGGQYSGLAYNDVVTVRTNMYSSSSYPTRYTDPDIVFKDANTSFTARSNTEFVSFEFVEPTEIKRIRFLSERIQEWVFEASADGTNWFEIEKKYITNETVTNATTYNAVNNEIIDKPVKVKFYRLRVLTFVAGNTTGTIKTPLSLE